QLEISKEVYVTQNERAAYFEDSPIHVGKQTIYEIASRRYQSQERQKVQKAQKQRAVKEAEVVAAKHADDVKQRNDDISQANDYNTKINVLTNLGSGGKPEDGHDAHDDHPAPPPGWHISHICSEFHRCALYVDWSDSSGNLQKSVCLWARDDYAKKPKT